MAFVRTRPLHFRPLGFRPVYFRPSSVRRVYQQYRDNFRVEAAAAPELPTYRAFVGEDALPDFTAAPTAEQQAVDDGSFFPFLVPVPGGLPGPGLTKKLYVGCRYADPFDRESLNQRVTLIEIDEFGVQVGPKPSAPIDTRILDQGGGNLLGRSIYYSRQDFENNTADEWMIYLRSNGTDPDPTIDVPAVVAMKGVPIEVLHEVLAGSPFGNGTDVRIIVRTRISATGEESDNLNVVQFVVDTDGPTDVADADQFMAEERDGR